MFIRQTRTNNKATGESYTTHRLVRSERIGGRVRQITLLNLGRHFPVKQEDWPLLCSRIETLIGGQASLSMPAPDAIEKAAQRYAGQLVARTPTSETLSGSPAAPAWDAVRTPVSTPARDFQEVDIGSQQLLLPRSVGV